MNDSNENKDLKDSLQKKNRAFRALKAHAKRKLDKEKEQISEEKEEKRKEIDYREEKIHEKFEKERAKVEKEAERSAKQIEHITEKEIQQARKELTSLEKRVYSRRRKIINGLQLAGVLYLFILSVIVMKEVAIALSSGTIESIASTVDSNLSAFGAGWFTTVIAQSGSVIAILANSLVGAGILSFDKGFYILLGISLGNPLTPVLASLVIKTKSHWDLRRGFELGLANIVYAFYLTVLVLLIQIPTGFFTSTGEAVAGWAEDFPVFLKIPDLLSIITDPLLKLIYFQSWPIAISFIFGVGILIFSLGRIGKSMFVFLGGKRHTRAIMEKFLGTYWKAFGLGLGLTIIIPSASLLTTLMVPLAVARIVKVRQVIPYLIGSSVATFIDVLLASLANAQPYAIAGGVVLSLIASLGVLFIFGNYGSNLVFKSTRYLSTHVIKMRRRNILKYIAGFIIIPALIVVIF